jgi:hypothetical protein
MPAIPEIRAADVLKFGASPPCLGPRREEPW